MSSGNQYGNALFISEFKPGATVKQLKRIHFTKSTSEAVPYDEAWLQALIMSHPNLLPIDQIEPAFANLVPICTELQSPSGFLDNLLLTPNGNIALIECKLWRNPEARRQVIAQIIDYANALSTWTYERLQEAVKHAIPAQMPRRRTRAYMKSSRYGMRSTNGLHRCYFAQSETREVLVAYCRGRNSGRS